MGKKILKTGLSILLLLILITGCSQPTVSPTDDPLPTQDRAGFDISVPTEVHKIISMAPSITLTLIDLGLEDKIIAMDTQSAALLKPKPNVPTFDMLSPDMESLAALGPDLILASAMTMMGNEANDPFEALKKLGICVAYIPTSESIAAIKEDVRFIATVTGREEKGEQLIGDMEHDIAEVSKMAEGQPGKTVYFEVGTAPSCSFGNGVYLNEMIELIGAKNILSDQKSWILVETESVVSANPDVIFTNVDYLDDPVAEILARPGWEEMSAVTNKQVYAIDNTSTAVPNHNITKGLKAMAECLYGPAK